MNLCRLQTFCECQWRQYAGQTFCHHGFATARRTNHDEVVTAGGSYFECALHIILPTYISKVEIKVILLLIEYFARVYFCRLDLSFASEKLNHVHEIVYAIDINVVYDSGLSYIFHRHDEGTEVFFTRSYGYRQSSFDRTYVSIKSKLAHKHIPLQIVYADVSACRKDAYCKRQIETTAFFAQIGRCHIYGDVGFREFEP